MHPTELPVGRGQAPIPWTIIKGLHGTALSVFGLSTAADAGPLIAQYKLAVNPRETSFSLYLRMAATHFQAGQELARMIAAQSVSGVAQDEVHATVWPKRRPSDGILKSSYSRQKVDAYVRALTWPYPRAFLEVDGWRLSVEATNFAGPLPEVMAGQEIASFTCSDGMLDILRQERKRL